MVFFNLSITTCHLLYMANATPRNATVHGREEGQTRYVGKYSPPPLCFAVQNIGEVARSAGGVRCGKGCLGNGERFYIDDSLTIHSLR